MDAIVKSFRTQKAGNAFEECEDKSYHKKLLNDKQWGYRVSNQSLLAFGVADGATEGMFSGVWAEILVKAFCRSKNNNTDIEYVVNKASKDWDSRMRNYIADRERHNKPIQWYEEPGLRTGSFSTLLGLILTYSEGYSNIWHALAVGDTCLFCVRDGKLVVRFPIKNSNDFTNRPPLISSKMERNKDLFESKRFFQSEWHAHDIFYIMTDALACWFLQEYEAGNSPWCSFPFVSHGSDEVTFESWVASLRNAKKMKNDDVTLIHVEVVE